MQSSGSTAGLRGIHAVGGGVAWVSGTNGTVLRTEDSGYMWQTCAMPPGAEKLDFRGIWAWDADTAIVMSSGPGDLSRVYETTDGCSHWKLLYTNPDKDGFWDAMVFSNSQYGIVLGDPTSNKKGDLEITLLSTFNGGGEWNREFYVGTSLIVPKGTSAFAASNSALVIVGHEAWFGVGGTSGPRVFLGNEYGPIDSGVCNCFPMPPYRIWFTHSVAVPLAGGVSSSGVFSLDRQTNGVPGDKGTLIAVGGDYTKPNESTGTAAWSSDGGEHWTASRKPPHGYRSAVEWDRYLGPWITVGTNGSDISYDRGKTWTPLDNGNWNALSLPWVVGPQGQIAKLDPGKLPQK